MPVSPRLAILIDAENMSAAYWHQIFDAATRLGTPVLVRAYACQGPPPGWLAIEDVEMVDGRPAGGPNAADFLLAMDAAAIAERDIVDVFIIVTGDDGFSTIAHGLKARGSTVYAFLPLALIGVPRRLASAADLAILLPPPPTFCAAAPRPMSQRASMIAEALLRCQRDRDGWADISKMGALLKGQGLSGKLTTIVRKLREFELDETGPVIKVRLRPITEAESYPDTEDATEAES